MGFEGVDKVVFEALGDWSGFCFFGFSVLLGVFLWFLDGLGMILEWLFNAMNSERFFSVFLAAFQRF